MTQELCLNERECTPRVQRTEDIADGVVRRRAAGLVMLPDVVDDFIQLHVNRVQRLFCKSPRRVELSRYGDGGERCVCA